MIADSPEVHARPGERRESQGLATLFRGAAVVTASLTLVCGVVYPLALYGIARAAFPDKASGSLVRNQAGRVVGSALLGQSFTEARYFHGRPSANGYDAANSSGTNLGPSNPKLISDAHRYAGAYRAENELAASAVLPIDAVTASGSGLDPHISPENARLQVHRVAHARAIRIDQVVALVDSHAEGRQLGILGEPRVNVLLLNLALDSLSRVAGSP